jgi:Mce-associated membrane protein
VALVIVLAAVLGVEVFVLRDRRGLPGARPAEIAVARTFAVDVTSFDYRRIDEDTARVAALATADDRPSLIATVGSSFSSGVVANSQILAGTVAEGPVVQDATVRQVVFLVVVSQRVTSVGSQSAPQVTRVALLVTVTRTPVPAVAAVERL